MKKIIALLCAFSMLISFAFTVGAEENADTVNQPTGTNDQTTADQGTPTGGQPDTSAPSDVQESAAPSAAEGTTAVAAEETVDPEDAARTEFKAYYSSYIGLYNGTYVPAYEAYNASLTALANRIKAANIETDEQLALIEAFLLDLKARRANFFGTRATVGKSRYVVPQLRSEMSAAFSNKDYTTAYSKCTELINAIHERINYLGAMRTLIDGFEIPEAPQQTNTAKVSFEVTRNDNNAYHEFMIVLRNDSDNEINNWSLQFKYNGGISNIWCNGSGMNFSNLGNEMYSVAPQNANQAAYKIPAHSSVTLQGNGNPVGTGVTNATFSGKAITVTFTK